MRGRHKRWAAPYLEEHPETVFQSIDPKDPFFKNAPIYLEIGIGKGDFITGMSVLKGGYWLGLERDISIMGMAAKKVVERSLSNIRLLPEDFDKVYEDMKELRFDNIYLNFSDPWPKKKHAKRRLTYHERLSNIASLLKEGGKIIMKSDNVALYEFTLEEIPLANLKIEYNTDDYPLNDEDVPTEYEKNFRAEGKKITRIIMTK